MELIYIDAYNILRNTILEELNDYIDALSTPELPLVHIDEKSLSDGEPILNKAVSINLTIDKEEDIDENETLENVVSVLTLNVDFLVNGSITRDTEINIKLKLGKYYLAFLTFLKNSEILNSSIGAIEVGTRDFYDGVEGNMATKAIRCPLGLLYERII